MAKLLENPLDPNWGMAADGYSNLLIALPQRPGIWNGKWEAGVGGAKWQQKGAAGRRKFSRDCQ